MILPYVRTRFGARENVNLRMRITFGCNLHAHEFLTIRLFSTSFLFVFSSLREISRLMVPPKARKFMEKKPGAFGLDIQSNGCDRANKDLDIGSVVSLLCFTGLT